MFSDLNRSKNSVQVFDRRIPKDLGLAVFGTRQAFGQMRNQLGQFAGERLFGQSDSFIEPIRTR